MLNWVYLCDCDYTDIWEKIKSDLGAAEHDQGLAYGRYTSTDVKGL